MKDSKKRWFHRKKAEKAEPEPKQINEFEVDSIEMQSDNNPAEPDKPKEGQYKKDIKFLWIYSAVFCIVVLALIGISAVIQVKMRARLEYYQSQAENANIDSTNSQSILKNIQDENAELKQQVTALTEQRDRLKEVEQTDLELLGRCEQMLQQAEYLINAQAQYISGRRQSARAELAKIEPELLDADMKEQYESLKNRLGE